MNASAKPGLHSRKIHSQPAPENAGTEHLEGRIVHVERRNRGRQKVAISVQWHFIVLVFGVPALNRGGD